MTKSPRRWTPLFTATAILLALVYALVPARRDEARSLNAQFYAPLRSQGISLDGRHTRNHLDAGQFTPWTHMTARAMLTRWRERHAAPFAVKALHDRWESGPWRLPTIEEWRETLIRLDQEWLQRRAEFPEPWHLTAAQALENNWTFTVFPVGAAERDPIVHADGTLEFVLTDQAPEHLRLLVKPTQLPTARIGDVLLVDWGTGDLSEPPVLYWSTRQLPERGDRRNMGQQHGESVRYGFSAEPGWICYDAQVWTWRFDLARQGDRIRLRGFRGEDSGEIR